MQSKSEVIDDSVINSLLQSNELKLIVKKLVQNEIKNSGSQESTIEKLTEIFNKTNIYEGKGPANPSKHSSTIPINDMRSDKLLYSEEDAYKRCSLASLFRLIDMEGWAKSIYNIVTLRSSESNNNFYVNPFGLLYHEITASSLIKISLDGIVLDSGSTILEINHTNWLIHKAIYKSRSDVNCLVQVSLPEVVAISSIKSGLLPVSVEAVKLLDVSQKSLSGGGVKYHSCNFNKEENFDRLITDLGQSKIIFLRNYCLLVCASSVAEAWILTKTVVTACQAQVRLIQLGGRDLLKSESNFTKLNTLFSDVNFEKSHSNESDIDLEAEMEFEAMMRLLDNAGYRTGHKYTNRQLTVTKSHSKVPIKVESMSSSEHEDHIGNGDIQVCPMPNEEHCTNDDEKEDNIQVCPMPAEATANGCEEKNLDCVDEIVNSRYDESSYERELVNEICTEVIDNSIRICESDATNQDEATA